MDMKTLTRKDMYDKEGNCILPVVRPKRDINRSKYCPCPKCKGGLKKC